MKTSLIISKNIILSDENEEYEFLYSYFSNHDIIISETPSHVEIQLDRKNFLYCEDISEGMNWLNISPEHVKDYYIEDDSYFFTLLESWITYGIGKYLLRNKSRHITLLHFDDHQDLMPPFIGGNQDNQIDLLTNSPYDFSDLTSVEQAIRSGAITLGSMLTPIVCAYKHIDIFHICNNSPNLSCPIHLDTIPNDPLFPRSNRIKIDFDSKHESTRTYSRSSDIGSIPSNIDPKSHVLLHFDMDYFNNRYNGSTDWNESHQTNNHPLNHQFERIDRICKYLYSTGLSRCIKHVSIGLSPSFYPVEFWKEGVRHLLYSLKSIGIPVEGLLNKIYFN